MKLLSLAASYVGILIACSGIGYGQGGRFSVPIGSAQESPLRQGRDQVGSEIGPAESLVAALERIEQLERRVGMGEVASAQPLIETDWLSGDCPTVDSTGCESAPSAASHYVTYQRGWTLRPYRPDQTPFEMKLELHNQFRFTQFSARGEPDPDATGTARDISDRNDFDINRGRVVFSGYAFSPDLGYYLNIDYSTVASDSILPLLGWTSFRISDRLSVFFGRGKVPGTWEWQQTSRYTLGVDRSMATTFFRPSISAGIWANGSLTDSLHYTVFAGDGFNTLTLRADAFLSS